MRICIETIPHERQKYDTSGDWWFEGPPAEPTLQIRVSKLEDERHEWLVAQHELVEALLCWERGIPEELVTQFDIETGLADPGASPDAPYHEEHEAACVAERFLAHELGVRWDQYEEAFDPLVWRAHDA